MQTAGYFRAIHGAVGSASAQDTLRREVRKDRMEDYATSIGYIPDAKRNGVIQPIVAKTTNVANRYNIITIPGDPLSVGDILEFYGEHWIVVDIKSVDVVSLIGIAMQCNHLFRWQNWTSDIIYRWGVLDSGVYSTTLAEEKVLIKPDKQYKVYLPFDDDSSKLFLGKRIATERIYNKDGKEILVTYEITGRDSVSESYGTGGHLLMLNLRSGADYYEDKDNLDLMICDYIPPSNVAMPPTQPNLLTCGILGISKLRVGFGEKCYSPVFYMADGVTEDTTVQAVWTVQIDPSMTGHITWRVYQNELFLSADEYAIGSHVTITVTDINGLYIVANYAVEVVSAI